MRQRSRRTCRASSWGKDASLREPVNPSWQGTPTTSVPPGDARVSAHRRCRVSAHRRCRVEALGHDRVHDPGQPVGAERRARAAPSPRRSGAPAPRSRVPSGLSGCTARVSAARRASRSPELLVDLVDEAAEERQRVGARARPSGCPGRVSSLAEPSVRSSSHQPAVRVERAGPGGCSRRPTGRSRPGRSPLTRSSSVPPIPCPAASGATYRRVQPVPRHDREAQRPAVRLGDPDVPRVEVPAADPGAHLGVGVDPGRHRGHGGGAGPDVQLGQRRAGRRARPAGAAGRPSARAHQWASRTTSSAWARSSG